MTTRSHFEQEITRRSNLPNINGYVSEHSLNLVDGVRVDHYENDLMEGNGNELTSKFLAVYSSSALCVNNFAIVKEHIGDFRFFDFSNFIDAKFERKFRTGLGGTPPHLDFALESNETAIGYESKYLEPLATTKAAFVDSYNRVRLNYLSDFWFSLIEYYRGKELYLDVAQLIKHAIGLINFKRQSGKEVILVYIFWTPINLDDYQEYEDHSRDLLEFTEKLKNQNDIKFLSMSYRQFWEGFENDPVFNNHFNIVKERYNIRIEENCDLTSFKNK